MYWDLVPSTQTRENTASVTIFVFVIDDSNWNRKEHKILGNGRMMEPQPDCVILGAVEAGLGGEGVVVDGHGDGLVRPVIGHRVDCSLSNSGLTFVAAASSVADWRQQTAGSIWNRLAAVRRLDSRLHLFPCQEKVT